MSAGSSPEKFPRSPDWHPVDIASVLAVLHEAETADALPEGWKPRGLSSKIAPDGTRITQTDLATLLLLPEGAQTNGFELLTDEEQHEAAVQLSPDEIVHRASRLRHTREDQHRPFTAQITIRPRARAPRGRPVRRRGSRRGGGASTRGSPGGDDPGEAESEPPLLLDAAWRSRYGRIDAVCRFRHELGWL
jgi:hypothetical protein